MSSLFKNFSRSEDEKWSWKDIGSSLSLHSSCIVSWRHEDEQTFFFVTRRIRQELVTIGTLCLVSFRKWQCVVISRSTRDSNRRNSDTEYDVNNEYYIEAYSLLSVRFHTESIRCCAKSKRPVHKDVMNAFRTFCIIESFLDEFHFLYLIWSNWLTRINEWRSWFSFRNIYIYIYIGTNYSSLFKKNWQDCDFIINDMSFFDEIIVSNRYPFYQGRYFLMSILWYNTALNSIYWSWISIIVIISSMKIGKRSK